MPFAATGKIARDTAWEGIALHLRQVKDVFLGIGEREPYNIPVNISEHRSTDLSLAS